MDCIYCHGTGRNEHGNTCEFCDGLGEQDDDDSDFDGNPDDYDDDSDWSDK